MIVPLPVGSVLGYVSFGIACIVMYWYWRDRRLARAKMAEYGPPLRTLLTNAHDPKFVGEALGYMLCMGKVDADGKPVMPSDIIYGMLQSLEPQAMAHIKEMAPDLIRVYLAGGADPDDPSELGRRLVARRGGKWAAGAKGVRAAAAIAPKAGFLQEIAGLAQALPDLIEAGKSLKDLMPSKGGQQGTQQQQQNGSQQSQGWRPPQ